MDTGFEWLELTPKELEQIKRELAHNHEPGHYYNWCSACVAEKELIEDLY